MDAAWAANDLIRSNAISKGLRASFTRAGGANTAYGYDPVSRLSSLSHDLAGTADDVTFAFPAYNAASQIRTRSIDKAAFVYSGTGNVIGAYVPNGLNQYVSAGGAAYAYDANGDLASDGATTFGYDVENRLVSGAGAKNATLAYDPKGRLFEVVSAGVTTRFLHDGDALVAEYNGSGTLLRRYVHGPGVDEPLLWYEGAAVSSAARRFLHANHQGSIVAVTNSSAGVLARNTFDSYGAPGAGNLGRFQYTGQIEIPELGLYHYKARAYSATIGRFLQTDPVGYDDQINLYAYVANDPVNKIDPTGEIIDTVLDAIFIVADAAILVADVVTTGGDNLGVNSAALGADVVGAAIPFATGGGLAVRAAREGGEKLTQRAATREAKRQAGIPTSQQAKSQTSATAKDGTKVGRQQTHETPKPGGGTQEKSVQVSRDQVGSHAGQPQIEAGNVKAGGQTDSAGRPRIENENKVRVDFDPDR